MADSPGPHSGFVRITHWITTACFFALLITGIEIVISHPRFYWGETGNVNTPALFELPIPASRSYVQTGYAYVLPDQNGWSRSLHFQSAWAFLFTGLWYGIAGLVTRHFRRHLLPSRSDIAWESIRQEIANHVRLRPAGGSYNVIQQLTYLAVIFVLFPLMIWTGLAMSPSVTSAFPFLVNIIGGHQSARTVHFVVTVLLVVFVVVHVAMICIAGFASRMRSMTIGSQELEERCPTDSLAAN